MITVLIWKKWISRIFAGCHFPTLATGACVREQKTPKSAILETEGDRGGILNLESPRGGTQTGGDGRNLAEKEAQDPDLVDHVDQDRPAATARSPGSGVKVIIRFAEQGCTLNANRRSKRIRAEEILCDTEKRAVGSVVADKHRHAPGFRSVDQGGSAPQGVGQGLLDQNRNPVLNAAHGLMVMGAVRCTQDRRIDLARHKRALHVVEQWHPLQGAERTMIVHIRRNDRNEPRIRMRCDQVGVLAPDKPRPGKNKAYFLGHADPRGKRLVRLSRVDSITRR